MKDLLEQIEKEMKKQRGVEPNVFTPDIEVMYHPSDKAARFNHHIKNNIRHSHKARRASRRSTTRVTLPKKVGVGNK